MNPPAPDVMPPAPAEEAAPARVIRAVVREPAPVVFEEADTSGIRAHRFERPPSNGNYHGAIPVRELPHGFSGEDLLELAERRLLAGAVWIRGRQSVRIQRATATSVTFIELDYGKAIRRSSRSAFLRQGRPRP